MYPLLIRRFSTQKPAIHVTIFGAGLLGAGLGQLFLTHKYPVTLVDVSPAALKKGREIIHSGLLKSHEPAQVHSFLSHLELSDNGVQAAAQADVLIEAVGEALTIKQGFFQRLLPLPPQAILATCTSSQSVSSISQSLAPDTLERLVGLHFFQPIGQVKLVEVIALPQTLPAVFDRFTTICASLDKTPVLCKDSPGFIVNRLLLPYLLEAAKMKQRGDAKVNDIDTAMKLGAGYPMGPFELMDYIGLDTIKALCERWSLDATALDDLIENGCYGRKSGAGFYQYSGVGSDQIKL